MNEKFDFLPLGSVVVVSGGIKKFVIVARALQVNINGCKQFFDYAACPYPEGMNGDRLMRQDCKEQCQSCFCHLKSIAFYCQYF